MHDLITFWNAEITKNNAPEIVESAFLRLYIEYENFLRKTFVKFALGSSYTSYLPQRKLQFSDETQLSEVIRGENLFVDYIRAIPRCAKHIFLKNPFDLVFGSQNYHDDLKKMKTIRNFLAHRSDEALGKYLNNVLKPYSINSYVEPGEFLLYQIPNLTSTYYTSYCEVFTQTSDLFSNDALLNAI